MLVFNLYGLEPFTLAQVHRVKLSNNTGLDVESQRSVGAKRRGREMVKSSSPSMVHVRLKLVRVVHRHQQMKAAFNNLRSQIKSGLIEAEDVFASLSIPLMKLVGLKTDEMAEQGRSTTILTGSTPAPAPAPPLQFFRRHASTDLHVSSGSGSGTGKKLLHQQRLQLQQLVHLLRGIESRVNSRQNNLLDTLQQQRLRLHHLFHNSIRHLSSFHQHTTTDEAPFLLPTLNIFHATFKHVASAFAAVHTGVEDLIADLAQHMCRPMTDYAKSLKAQMDAGALLRLVSLVENMEAALAAAQVQLDQARGKAKLEEDTKLQALTMLRDSEQRELEALNKLRDSENKTLAITQFVAFLLDSQKFLAMEEDQAGDEKLLWDLLKENKHVKAQASPLGTKELLHVESSKNHKHIGDNKNSGRTEHKASYRPVTRSFTKGFSTGSPFPDAWLRLGSSPSGVDQTVGHKQASPLLRIRRGTPHQ